MVASAVAPFPILIDALSMAFDRIRYTIPVLGADRPMVGRDDLTYARSHANHWVDGFWSGQLWLAYAKTGDREFFDAARRQRAYFADRLARPHSHDHDLGFLYSLSVVADYRLTGDETARQMGLAAAHALAARFNPHGKFIRAWNDWPSETSAWRMRKRGKMIVDCMENLALLCWAGEASGNPKFRTIAIEHATTAAHTLVRSDGSTYHTYNFDPLAGRPLGGETYQGYSDESCWSRGQAWGIHGFAQMYANTGIARFRDTAQQLADYAIAHLPPDGVPLWDYCLPADAPQYRDSSAAAITAAGLLLLADRCDERRASAYRSAGHLILNELIANYTTARHPRAEGLLLHGAAFVAEGLVDTMLPYGDYYYLEALSRALGRTQFFW